MSYLSSLITEFLKILYLGNLFFAKPEIVAKANIPKRAIPRNNPAPWLTPAPTATSIESLIRRLINNAGVNIFQRVPPIPIA
jgi:predicted RNA polymerase sigma factor